MTDTTPMPLLEALHKGRRYQGDGEARRIIRAIIAELDRVKATLPDEEPGSPIETAGERNGYTVSSLMDRLDRIYLIAIGAESSTVRCLRIADLSSGFAPAPGSPEKTSAPQCEHEFELIDEGGGGSEFQPPDPPVYRCCLCGSTSNSPENGSVTKNEDNK